MHRKPLIAALLILTPLIVWSQTTVSTKPPAMFVVEHESDCVAVEACLAEIDLVIEEMAGIAKAERDEAVDAAIAAEREFYEPLVERLEKEAEGFRQLAADRRFWHEYGVIVGVLALLVGAAGGIIFE